MDFEGWKEGELDFNRDDRALGGLSRAPTALAGVLVGLGVAFRPSRPAELGEDDLLARIACNDILESGEV